MRAFSITLSLFTISCSLSYHTNYKAPERIHAYKKIQRQKVPQFNVLGDLIEQQSFRVPASVEEKKALAIKSIDPGDKMTGGHSDKRLYFLSLLAQYDRLESFFHGRQKKESCPGFHSSMLTYRTQSKKHTTKPFVVPSVNKDQLKNRRLLSLFPELLLPMDLKKDRPRVADLMISKPSLLHVHLKKGLKTHLKKIRNELEELCQTGTAQNYYNYENLLTLFRGKQRLPASEKNMKILFKITVFANMFLIHSLEYNSKKRSFVADPYTNEIIRRLNASWLWRYLEKVDREKRLSTKHIQAMAGGDKGQFPLSRLEIVKDS